jgi:hypothetical protein
MSIDPTETFRRIVLAHQVVRSRDELVAKFGDEDVFDTAQLSAAFTVHSFLAPFVHVTRHADGMVGTLEFQHAPRFYFRFVADRLANR